MVLLLVVDRAMAGAADDSELRQIKREIVTSACRVGAATV
jgi:hypothetical protein